MAPLPFQHLLGGYTLLKNVYASHQKRLPIMARVLADSSPRTVADIGDGSLASSARPVYQAYLMLHVGFAALPFMAGLDKFFHLLVNWDQYLAPLATQLLPVSGHTFMLFVGVVEIAAGVLVAFRPQIGAYVVAFWLWGIIINLLLIPKFYDAALRDFGLCRRVT